MFYFKIFILVTMHALAPAAFGAWASGGGQIHGDGHNPWFLENTVQVNYCIDLDEQAFGVTAADASAQVRAAVDEWLNVLLESDDNYYDEGTLKPYGQLRIGTQRFTEVSCLDHRKIDLRFQLGRLTDDQRQLFHNPKEYVGIAVRTDYDRKNLRGAGFIYLAPISGPLAPNHDRLHPEAWTKKQFFALKMVLRHELGHVFGIEHQAESLMDERWPELMVDQQFLDGLTPPAQRYLTKRGTIRRMFGFVERHVIEECGDRNPIFAIDIFGKAYSEEACGRITFENDQLTVAYKARAAGEFETIGTAIFTSKHFNSSPAVTVYLPEDQEVFSHLPEEARHLRRLFGEKKNTSMKWSNVLKIEATGDLLPLQIESNADSISATVIKDGRFRNDAFFLE